MDPEQVWEGRDEEMKTTWSRRLGCLSLVRGKKRRRKQASLRPRRKRIDRVKKDDDGRAFVRCRLVARDFKPRREGPRDDRFSAMPPLEAKKALFAHAAEGCARRDENRTSTK